MLLPLEFGYEKLMFGGIVVVNSFLLSGLLLCAELLDEASNPGVWLAVEFCAAFDCALRCMMFPLPSCVA